MILGIPAKKPGFLQDGKMPGNTMHALNSLLNDASSQLYEMA
jgi:hypothetical protein